MHHGRPAPVNHDTHATLQHVAMAPGALEALDRFRQHTARLRGWQLLYADPHPQGPFPLRHQALDGGGLWTSVFRPGALWTLDERSVACDAPLPLLCGTGLYLDTNAASHIRTMAYEARPPGKAVQAARAMRALGPALQQINPALYLWEARRHWTPKTIARCRETLAAVHALGASGSTPSLEWGQRFRGSFQDSAERMADALLAGFQAQWAGGLADEIDGQLAMMEAVLVRCMILRLGSQKSPRHKLAELLRFMDEQLHTVLLRELLVCGDMLRRPGGSRLAQKLNSPQNHPRPRALLRNCAWDLFIPRALEMLSGAHQPEASPLLHLYLPEVLSFDRDVADMLNLTRLRALAVHRGSLLTRPFFDNDVMAWLTEGLGDQYQALLARVFEPDAFDRRMRTRSVEGTRAVLARDWETLEAMLAARSPSD